MLFPDVERVIYNKNPLVEVICQFRYPAILRINTQEPVEFQEKIRQDFPLLREKSGISIQLPPEIAQILPPEVAGSLRGTKKAYEFATADDKWIVGLTRDFLALTNQEYIRWEHFRQKLEKPVEALNEVYLPSFLSRIGLRYQNVIQRSKLGLQDVEWSKLINPALAGLLSSGVEKFVEDTTQITVLKLEDISGKVRIRHGLAKHNETGEICFLIDNDFFLEGEENIQNGLNILDEFNRRNHSLFRWCITDTLHESMEPAKANI